MTQFRAGPPPTQLPPDIKETEPKRRGRPPGSKTGAAAPSKRSLEQPLAATLMGINLVLMMIPPLQKDQLDEVEITALARALDAQARSSVRFRKMLEGALAVTSGGQLMGVIMIVGARRASRHGYLPPEADGQFGALLGASVQKKAEQDRSNGTV